MVVMGRSGLAWLFAFCQSVFYVTAVVSVLTNIDNWLNVIGYSAGFATGNVVGMWIDERLAFGVLNLTIISSGWGTSIAEKLRQEGYAVTEVAARGRNGMVTQLACFVRRKHISEIEQLVNQIDEQAFITAELVRSVRRGFWN